jgi:hypothetical protein
VSGVANIMDRETAGGRGCPPGLRPLNSGQRRALIARTLSKPSKLEKLK